MTHTVIGLFDNKSEANQAVEELTREGFIRESIDLSSGRTTDSSSNQATSTPNAGVGDSISNFFGSLFGADDPATRTYTEAARGAEAILTIQVDSEKRAGEAAAILDRNGAIDVDERGAQSSPSNFADTNAAATQNATTSTNESAIPIIEEELQVGKRAVESGRAHIRSRVVEKPVEENLRLREEHIFVQRRPVNRAVTESDLANFKEGDIEITEHAEEAVVSKQARVVEEVAIGKTVEEHDEVVRDTVRHTEVDVQETGGNAVTNRDAAVDKNVNKQRATGK